MDPNERYNFLFRKKKCCKARKETQPNRIEMQYSWVEPLQHQGQRTKSHTLKITQPRTIYGIKGERGCINFHVCQKKKKQLIGVIQKDVLSKFRDVSKQLFFYFLELMVF